MEIEKKKHCKVTQTQKFKMVCIRLYVGINCYVIDNLTTLYRTTDYGTGGHRFPYEKELEWIFRDGWGH